MDIESKQCNCYPANIYIYDFFLFDEKYNS